MATVKVVVTALQRYWALGRCFEAGETELELDESQLPVLDAAKGGQVLQQNELGRANPEQRAPCVLTYRIVADPPPAPPSIEEAKPDVQPAPALEVTDAPGEVPAYEPEPEAPTEG